MWQKRKTDGNQPDIPISDTELKHQTYSKLKTTLLIISLLINGVVTDESVSAYEGDPVTLHTDLTNIQRDDLIEWRFGDQLDRIAQINREADFIRIYDNVLDGRFRDRLKLNTENGDLTITNITTQHTGLYKLDISNREKITTKIFSVNVSVDTGKGKTLEDSVIPHNNVTNVKVNDDQSSSKSSGVVAGLCVFLLVLVFALALAIFLYRRLSRTTRQRVSKDDETFQD
ncbi:uncharacterized protein [Paramisgurnus dabryanus]|uniref:uncharacterized protein n=1 Tax=Paramisgurnus dabryanus TaxID=90735 RepID=UPI0031F361EA